MSIDSNTDFFLGLGLEYALNPRWEVGAGWERYRFENHDVDFLNVGISYRFGRKQQSKPAPVATVAEPEPIAEPVVEPVVLPVEPQPVAMTESACKLFQGTLEGVNFESGSAMLTSQAKEILQTAADTLRDIPTVSVEIHAHTDQVGSASANQSLSEARADAVKVFLIEQGIAADRLTAIRFGEAQPIADNNTAEGRAANRRVELKHPEQDSEQKNDVDVSSCP